MPTAVVPATLHHVPLHELEELKGVGHRVISAVHKFRVTQINSRTPGAGPAKGKKEWTALVKFTFVRRDRTCFTLTTDKTLFRLGMHRCVKLHLSDGKETIVLLN